MSNIENQENNEIPIMYTNMSGSPYTNRTTENIGVGSGAINPSEPIKISVAASEFESIGVGTRAVVTYTHNLGYIPLFEGEVRVVGTNNYRSIPYRENTTAEPESVVLTDLNRTTLEIQILLEGAGKAHDIILYLNQEGTNIIE